MDRWEHTIVTAGGSESGATDRWESTLNALGADGWELVSEHKTTPDVGGDTRTRPTLYQGTFKRRVV